MRILNHISTTRLVRTLRVPAALAAVCPFGAVRGNPADPLVKSDLTKNVTVHSPLLKKRFCQRIIQIKDGRIKCSATKKT